ncbi:hypothetical protein JG688_00010935 [Phytophthora aleatoria]|uniref:Uncharacterized protein n=1 Tax=Phytophthora aleatoria TaxID=2496075 RepID=A0A8J5MFA1_9STRA|nr:hypothetical protein JG688_00010935 [Phytophthora aleatoria]
MPFVSGLTNAGRYTLNARVNQQKVTTSTQSQSDYWKRPRPFSQNTYLTALGYRKSIKPTIPIAHNVADHPSATQADGADGSTRRFSLLAAEDDTLPPTEVSYPIAPDTSCDCVTFPEEEDPTITDCSDEITWGSFQILFSDGCMNLEFDASDVYVNCPSESEQSPDFALCEIIFTDESTTNEFSTTGDSQGTSSSSNGGGGSAIYLLGGSSSTSHSTTLPTEVSTPAAGQVDMATSAPSVAASSTTNPTGRPTIARFLVFVVLATLAMQ